MDPGERPQRGRGREGGGWNIKHVSEVDVGTVDPEPSTSSSGRCRGRGRGTQHGRLPPASASTDPSPVTLPDNPEDDDLIDALRRLQMQKESVGGRGRGRGRGLPFSIPSVSFTPNTQPPSGLTPPSNSPFELPSGVVSDVGRKIKHGTKGRPVPLTANFLRLTLTEEMGLYEYHVDFVPEVDSMRLKRKIISLIGQQLGSARTFDGSKLYLAVELPEIFSQFSIPNPNNPSQLVSVKIKFVKRNTLHQCIHFYNVLFRRIMEILGHVEMKRHFYNHRAVYDIPQHKLEIWPGYVTAIDEYQGGLMLCCDSSFRVLRTSTIFEILNDFATENPQDTASTSHDASSRTNFENYVLGKIVLTKYNNRNYRIDGVDWGKTPLSKFTNSKGQELTFVEYYKGAYNIDIQNFSQPLLVHRPKPNLRVGPIPLICLIPELCYITGMDSSITSNYEIMKDVALFTKLTPHQRNLAIQKFVQNINENVEAKSVLQSWGLRLEEAAVKLEGRVLTAPQITFNSRSDFHPDANCQFSEKVVRNAVFDPIPVKNWLIFFASIDQRKAQKFVEVYRHVSRSFGIPVSFTEDYAINVGKGQLRDFSDGLNRNLNPNVQFVVIIVPSQREDLYSMIKQVCTVHKPVSSQVILSKTLGNERKFRSVVQKIALQINCKIGGALWSIRIPLPEKIMFIGLDVYHDPKRKNSSVTGIVGSLNTGCTKYYSRVIFQSCHQETVNSMLPILSDMLIAFAEENNGFPDRVIVWRDGVSDGQLTFTKEHEVTQILSAFKNFSINPKFTFCVVQKRINARLFLQEEYGPFINPDPGTVVDHTITRRCLYDFFLVSQFVRDGTVTPTHYVVLEDNADVPPDLVQKFAFATSFMYYNWSGSIRVPAMCQYAHKLAALVGQYTVREPSMELSKNLYYL